MNYHNFQKLTVDQNSKNAIWGDEVIPLSDNEYKVLTLLYQNRGETVNRETIDMLLGADDSNMGDVYVCHLRKKIEELTREVRAHNNFAQRMPVVEEQIKVINHRLTDLEEFHKPH